MELVNLLDGVSESFEGPWWTFCKELVDLLDGVSEPFGGS